MRPLFKSGYDKFGYGARISRKFWIKHQQKNHINLDPIFGSSNFPTLAYIAHQAPSLPLSAQTAIARGLALCFMIETVLYGYYAAFGLASSSPEYRVGVICTGSIFVVLWAAYSAALLGASVPAAPKKS